MIEVPVPDGRDEARSFAACVAAILELPIDDLPVPAEADVPLAVNWWLQGRDLGLVPVADAATFSWPGHWIGLLRDGATAVVMFGAPAGVLWDPLGRADVGAPLAAGWVIAPLAHDVRKRGQSPFSHGHVEEIFIAPAAEAAPTAVGRATAVAGSGLEGDRYAARAGTFSLNSAPGSGHQVTLVDAELLEAAGVSAAEARRNVVTRGIDLDALIGRRFAIGAVELAGRRRCEPCAHLERITRPGVLRDLVHRAGLRADILSGGEIAVGDEIRALDQGRALAVDR